MADEWMKVRLELPTDERVIRAALALAERQGREPDPADRTLIIGGCVRLWIIGHRHARAGKLKGWTPDMVDAEVGVQGFAESLMQVDWLRADSEKVTLPRFDRNNGSTAKKRAQASRRQATYRERKKRDNSNARVTLGASPEKNETETEKKSKSIRTRKVCAVGNSGSDSTARLMAWQEWGEAVARLWAPRGDAKQHNADRTDTRTMFDDHVWPDDLDDELGKLRMAEAMGLVATAAKNASGRPMRYLWSLLRKHFPATEAA